MNKDALSFYAASDYTTEDAPILSRLIASSAFLLLLLSFSLSPGCALPPIPWNNSAQGAFITALCGDRQGHIWAGTEDWGVWEWNGKVWTQFTSENTHGGLGDDDIYSLTCDKLGRIWAGTDRHGVCVFNGSAWQDYDRVTGPLGCHVIALTTSPLDGDVWGATEAGLFRYSLHDKIWAYTTRATGLPSDQADSLAFAKNGTLFVGTLCNGIAIGSASNDYHTWTNVAGPNTIPDTSGGPGLPTNQINCLLVTRGGTVYAGTTTGLAHSSDNGKTWSFIRGADWKDKLAGLEYPVAPVETDTHHLLLSEDYVTALAEDAEGHLYIGHRQTGLGQYDEITEAGNTPKSHYGGFVDALLVTQDGRVLIGTYGDGLQQTSWNPPASSALKARTAKRLVTPFPVPAKPPTVAQLTMMLKQVQSLNTPLQPGQAVYLGEDWQTQGDEIGHYGRQYAILCAADAPLDHDVISDGNYNVVGSMGPHHASGDSLRRWCTWADTDNPKCLYDPIPGNRRQAEWDDHGESTVAANGTFPFQGPDVWATISVPAGPQMISIYDMNKDGHDGTNRDRDYLVDLYPYQSSMADAQAGNALAQARIRNFWEGVYESFLVCGPATYYLRVDKNYSFNTILAGVFIDRIGTVKTRNDCRAWMGGVRYSPPDPDAPVPPNPHLLDILLANGGKLPAAMQPVRLSSQDQSLISEARALWSTLDQGWADSGITSCQEPFRMAAYRAIVQSGGSATLQSNYRWALHIWNPSDRLNFTDTMQEAHNSLLALYPDMKSHSY